ncbi:coproporphyrinogen dehydrogenase HemZ [Tissierella sp. P1]|uniref:coproporphyrinogen dehydrogenase HemZ n=1 Tax=Tissierella sp. P1 TaxID=1280483 RepID=UPI000BA0899E|nr:coproporphyrinogen dehydrogenase HemZ [Tissierella sp. P1]MDU5081172.1 coproporphyrinogen dehydrogenase HemZ [Bacillota bacterium]OZV10710.1 coproporphyrinogen dehydrogenase HemZ [Tissierella sp. P1]
MIKLLLIGHEIKYELVELIRVFFPGEEILYISRLDEYTGEGTLIINSLYEEDGKLYTITKIYIDNILINQATENISTLEVYGDSIDKYIRIGIKKSLYNTLISLGESKIPWGVLTGIRPVKIVHDLLDKDINENEIIRVLAEEYKLSFDKAKLILDIGRRQRDYIYPLNKDRYSLYVSIPFCPTRCLYCSFPALPIGRYENHIKEYTLKVIYEIEQISEMMKGKKINTVYIGGGTPTAIPLMELEKIIQAIYYRFGEKNIKEFTVEAGRPDTITKEYLTMLYKNEVGRISINPQTMNDDTLKLIGRQHKSKDIIETFNLAKEIGFDIINMDLIVGLPGEEIKHIKKTLEEIQKLDPENLTIHTLSVKRGSKFKATIDQYSLQSQNILSAMLNETREYTKDMGLEPYYLYRQKQILGNFENIGYCKAKMECIYNIAMMEEKETIMAAGMGSVSKIFFPEENRIERVPNFKDLKEYLERSSELIERKKKILGNN